MEPIWKDIEGYEGLYQVSSAGDVKSLTSTIRATSFSFTLNDRILKQEINKGYKRVTLSKENRVKRFLVHTLVANAFLGKDQKRFFINHIDGDKSNNHINNLEWCTRSENELHSYRVLGKRASLAKRCIDHNTGIIYDSITKAAIDIGIKPTTLLAKLNGQNINNTSVCLL